MKLQSSSAKRKARIEIIPLIDIMFFLLATFVMVSLSMIKNQGIQVHLPAASTSVPQERGQNLTLSVTREGELYLDKQLVSRESLPTQLNIWKTRQTDPRVFIHGDEETPFKNMMFVMDALRRLGITKVAMQTRSSSPGENT